MNVKWGQLMLHLQSIFNIKFFLQENYALFLILIISIVFPLTVIPYKFHTDITEYIPPTDDQIYSKHNFMKIEIFYKILSWGTWGPGPPGPFVGPL